MRTKALYAGSFDPLTLGHLDIIKRASGIFDEVIIGVVVNLEKKTMFSFEERMEMIEEAVSELDNVKVDMCDGLLADFVNRNNFNVVVRGLRGMSDFDSEQQMAQLHRLMADSKYAFISSTMAKQVISLGGAGENLVPPCVLEKMKGRLNK